jgi:hypothetical protein
MAIYKIFSVAGSSLACGVRFNDTLNGGAGNEKLTCGAGAGTAELARLLSAPDQVAQSGAVPNDDDTSTGINNSGGTP